VARRSSRLGPSAPSGPSSSATNQRYGVFARQLTKLWHDHADHTLARGNALAGPAETVRDQLVAQVRHAPMNYFEATLAFGDLTLDEALANLAASLRW
jgi:hypothetical protein